MVSAFTRNWFRLVGLVLLVGLLLFFKVDLHRTGVLLLSADPFYLVLAVILFLPFIAAKAWRWQVILSDLGISIPFIEAARLYALGLGAATITPGQVGEAAKAAYLANRGLGRVLLSILLDRLWDVLILLLLAATGTLLFWRQFQSEWIALAAVGAASVMLIGLVASPAAQRVLIIMLNKMRGARPGMAFEPVRLSLSQIARQFGITILATSIVYLRYLLIVSAMDVRLEIVPFIATMSLATIASLVPISISGLGARDAALLMAAPLIGISPEQAIGISTLILFMSVLNGIVGFSIWLLSGPKGKIEKPNENHSTQKFQSVDAPAALAPAAAIPRQPEGK